MPRPNYKTMYEALVVNADQTTAKLRNESELLRRDLRWANEKLASIELKVDIVLGVFGGKKEDKTE